MEWQIEDKYLTKSFTFENFLEAIDFVNNVAVVAEDAEHHPDILIHDYNQVKIMMYTHSEDKITEKDYSLAKQIDSI